MKRMPRALLKSLKEEKYEAVAKHLRTGNNISARVVTPSEQPILLAFLAVENCKVTKIGVFVETLQGEESMIDVQVAYPGGRITNNQFPIALGYNSGEGLTELTIGSRFQIIAVDPDKLGPVWVTIGVE